MFDDLRKKVDAVLAEVTGGSLSIKTLTRARDTARDLMQDKDAEAGDFRETATSTGDLRMPAVEEAMKRVEATRNYGPDRRDAALASLGKALSALLPDAKNE